MAPKPTPKPKKPPPPAAGAAAAAAPATPVRARRPETDPGREHVAKLNSDYNLGVPLAEGPQSPADKERQARVDASFRRHNSITNLLRIHHYKNSSRLQAVLDDFDVQAREQSSNWVRKTRAARGVLPSPKLDGTPRAQRVEDQVAMQELLLALLEASKTTLAHGSSQGLAAAVAVIDANAQLDDDLAAEIDRVPVIPRIGLPVVRTKAQAIVDGKNGGNDGNGGGFVPEENRPRSPSGSSTSSMYSALDSFEVRFESQTTMDAGADADADAGAETEGFADEEWERKTLRKPASQESFAVSETALEALEESFGLYDIGIPSASQQRPDSPSSTTYSSIPEMEDLQLSDDEYNGAQDQPYSGPSDPVPGLWNRLLPIFPSMPTWLKQAPFPIIWETTRIALRCGVNLDNVKMSYSQAWEDQNVFRDALQQHPQFAGKRLPEQSTQVAWDSALDRHTAHGGTKRVAVYTMLMGFNKSTSGPLYSIHLQPLSIDLPHRLSRHFGPDRFLEILFPSHHSSVSSVPHILRNHEEAVREVNYWLTRQCHQFAGRSWTAFYTKDDGYKKPTSASRDGLGEKDEVVLLKRVFLFAEEGAGISPVVVGQTAAGPGSRITPSSSQKTGPLRVHEMLDWLLQYNKFPQNRGQPYLKLFSRIALGLSRTKPTVVFEPNQLRRHDDDLLSSTGKVMNDGVARMSLSVARKLRSALELSDLPVAVQGRIGSAKGMWILDTEDTGREDWIETYPSQEKWQCDYLDADHRTLEVRNFASESRSAGLNLQFIPILEDCAVDKARMRSVLGGILEGNLTRDLADQRAALENPLLFSAWIHENSRYRNDHVIHCQVPFLGGLPDRDEDAIQFLLAGGFDPLQQRFLWDKAYEMQKQRCEKLNEKLSVRVGRTAYLLMVVDFLGVLEEGEVQVCFSSKFQVEPDSEPDERGDDGSFSDTLLVGTDVLVARSPAHFASDMQKVRAVFRQELCALKDVIIFSSKGDSPLADKLSGGDYDGDMAWVCWDRRIVDNFTNAPMPPTYDLLEMGYMRKIRTTLGQLAEASPDSGGGIGDLTPLVLADMMERSFAFNMKENLLGKMTAYKEELCYMRGHIGDRTANLMSTLLSDLVDQAKQGHEFTTEDFNRLRAECLEGIRGGVPPAKRLPKPAYKGNSRNARAKQMAHIIDYLKFDVAKPIIRLELRALSDFREAMSNRGDRRNDGYWDADLAAPAKHFEALAGQSAVCYAVFEALKGDILAVRTNWDKVIKQWKFTDGGSTAGGGGGGSGTFDDPGFRQRFLQLYQQWCNISVRLPAPPADAEASSSTASPSKPKKKSPLVGSAGEETDADAKAVPWLLRQEYLADHEYSQWALIRASQTFRMLYYNSPRLVWRLAGRQLQVIKASMAGGGSEAQDAQGSYKYKNKNNGGLGGAKVFMTSLTFAATRPDRQIIKRMTARLQGAEVEGIDYDDADNLCADDT